MRWLFLGSMSSLALSALPQEVSGPLFEPTKVYSIHELIPSGWSLLDSVSGHLNDDRNLDVAYVLQRTDSSMIIDEQFGREDGMYANRRVLAVFQGGSDPTKLRLVDQSDKIIPLHYMGISSDPYESITIEAGELELHCLDWTSMGSLWMTSWTYTFRLHEGSFRLVRSDVHSLNRASHEGSDHVFEFLKNIYTETMNADLAPDGRGQQSQGTLIDIPIMTLGTLPKQGTWEILPGVFL